MKNQTKYVIKADLDNLMERFPETEDMSQHEKEEFIIKTFESWSREIMKPKTILTIIPNDFEVFKMDLESGQQIIMEPMVRDGEPVVKKIKIEAKSIYTFLNHRHWVNKASTNIGCYDRSELIICIDTNGNVLTIGKDFRIADEQGLFPVTAYRCIRTSEANA